jgi:hypothetical protein
MKHENLLLNRLNLKKGVEEQTKLYKASADSYEKIFDECLEENIGDKISDAKEINVQK